MDTESLIALTGLMVTILFFALQARNATRVRQSEIYQSLELAANEVFRFEAQYAEQLVPFSTTEIPSVEPSPQDARIADQRLYQILGLFEIASRFRKEKIFVPAVYASWVAWQYDLLRGWYFRQSWPEMSENYTQELRDIFDLPVQRYRPERADLLQKIEFYHHVAAQLDCKEISAVAAMFEPEPLPGHSIAACHCRWLAAGEDGAAVAAFLSEETGRDLKYISHGEIQSGLSPDGWCWGKDAPAITRRWLAGLLAGDDRSIVVAERADGSLVGVAVLDWQRSEATTYAILADMVVHHDCRSLGIGAKLLAEVEAVVTPHWLFLESGIANHDAHRFFEQAGFRLLSRVYGKPLGGA